MKERGEGGRSYRARLFTITTLDLGYNPYLLYESALCRDVHLSLTMESFLGQLSTLSDFLVHNVFPQYMNLRVAHYPNTENSIIHRLFLVLFYVARHDSALS